MGDENCCWDSVTGERILCCANGEVRLPGQWLPSSSPPFPVLWTIGQLTPGPMCDTFCPYWVGCGDNGVACELLRDELGKTAKDRQLLGIGRPGRGGEGWCPHPVPRAVSQSLSWWAEEVGKSHLLYWETQLTLSTVILEIYPTMFCPSPTP